MSQAPFTPTPGRSAVNSSIWSALTRYRAQAKCSARFYQATRKDWNRKEHFHSMPRLFLQSLHGFCNRKQKFCKHSNLKKKPSFASWLRQPWRLFPSILNTDQMAGKLTLFKSGNSGSSTAPLPVPRPDPPPSSTTSTTTTHSSSASLSLLLKITTAVYKRVTGSS